MKNICLILLLLNFAQFCSAQKLFGKLTDKNGEVLSFASVYITGTSTGTTTNIDGYYEIEVEAGSYEFAFQYIGYETQTQSVVIVDQDVELNIVLAFQSNNLQEIVVTAGEDPAYRIIRKAIKKRKYYANQIKTYSCESYVKGTQYIKNLPKTFMGQSLEGFRQGLDSNGTGIIYLSESLSTLHYKDGEYKEIMTSSKVSGNDNGFSFNSGAALAEFSFYRNSFELGDTKILSPIGNGALGAYNYRLISTFKDKDDRTIHQIAVLPKNKMGAVFQGDIYIVDEDWAIYSTDLFTLGKAVNISVLDTVRFKQTHINLGGDTWRVFSQDIQFNLKLLFIATKGNFVGVFSDYNLKPTFEKNFFNAEIFKVEDLANKKLSEHWDSIRPMPLSGEEKTEYQVKDSLQEIWSSKSYQDSMDKKNNIPGIMDIIGGYTFRNSYKNYRISILPPLDRVVFNTVQGQMLGLGLEFYKGLDKEDTRWYKFHVEGEYGIDDKQWRGKGFFQMKFNSKTNNFLHVEGGRQLAQFNPSQPISPLINNYYSLLLKKNYAKYYDETFARLFYSQYITNGLLLRAGVRYANRAAEVNHTDFAWAYKNETPYYSNHPLDQNQPPMKDVPSFLTHQHLEFSLALRIRFGQKYISYPNRRFYTSSKFPDIWLRYRRGIPLLGGDTNFDYLELQITKEDIPLGVVGLFSFNAKGGWFPYTSELFFLDYHHFNGNQTMFTGAAAYLNTFQLLPYYEYSTKTAFAELHLQHDFNGYIWNKIPGLKALGFEFVTGAHFLYTPEQKPYMEFNLGIDRIGWKLFRFLRADFVMGYRPGERLRIGGVLSLNISL